MNIKFSYLYRDAGNYKNYNDIIFSNPNYLPLEEIQAIINRYLTEGFWFDAEKWQVPDLHFKEYNWSNELDHGWHELVEVAATSEQLITEKTINNFLNILRKY